MIVRKKEAPPVTACCLGLGSALERELTEEGLLAERPDGRYEVFSRESGESGGELARPGDFVKVDAGGFPYPVAAESFLEEHRPTAGGYVQIPRRLEAWTAEEPHPAALEWLLAEGRLRLDPQDSARFFRAELWGTQLAAPKDAVLVFYRVHRDLQGEIRDVEFNFVDREIFAQSYEILEDA